MLEAYSTLGYLAAHTSRVRLGTLVKGAFYRHPGLLAKIGGVNGVSQVTPLEVIGSEVIPEVAKLNA